MKTTNLDRNVWGVIAIVLSLLLVKDKGAATILLVAASGILTYLLTIAWQNR